MKLGNFFKIKIKTDFEVVANNNISKKIIHELWTHYQLYGAFNLLSNAGFRLMSHLLCAPVFSSVFSKQAQIKHMSDMGSGKK